MKLQTHFDALDQLWAKVIKHSMPLCVKCGSAPVDAHHIHSRRNLMTRWHKLNGVSLCRQHHNWAHANKAKFHRFLKENGLWPEGIREASQHTAHFTDADYSSIRESLNLFLHIS